MFDEMFNGFNEREINGVKIYSVSNEAVARYRREAKRDKNISRDILEVKLTAMILSSEVMRKLSGKVIYRFGGFCMLVNERTRKIEMVSWLFDTHDSKDYLTMIGKKLKENNRLLGLNIKGNSYLKDTDEELVAV